MYWPLTGVDRVLVELREDLRASEVAREASESPRSETPVDPHSVSYRTVTSEPVPELLFVLRVTVPPNPVVSPPAHSDALAALGPICEAEGLPCQSSIEEVLELAKNLVRDAAVVRPLGAVSADLDFFNGKRRHQNFVR